MDQARRRSKVAPMQHTKILITGSLGHIGSQVIPLFPDRFDLKLTDINEGMIGERPVHALDITDYDALLEASKGMDAILHLAITSARNIVTDRRKFAAAQGEEYLKFNDSSIDTNVRGTWHVFEAARQNGLSRVVYGSSLTVLIGKPCYPAVNDDLPPRPVNFYGLTKLWGEYLGEFFSRTYGLRTYCLRFGTPYPWLTTDRDFKKWSAMTPVGRRTLVSYADLAGAMTAALKADGPLFGAYTVVSHCPENVFDLSKAAEIGWSPGDFVEADGSIRPATPTERSAS